MKHIIGFLLKFVICVFVIYGGFCGVAVACENNEIDVLGDSTQCELAKFSLTTTNMNADTEFRFYMSASGTFYVDWGDGTVDTITRTNTTETLYSHTFTTSGTKTIRFGGMATGYNTSSTIATIRFGKSDNNSASSSNNSATVSLVKSVSGSLSQLFPVFGTTASQNPKFVYTFYYCNNLISIPETLFSDYTQIKTSFNRTFAYTGLTSIPAGLFSYITEAVGQMFFYTFNGCYGITSIPAGLFSGITTITGNAVFYGTFRSTGITSIPENLFDKITTAQKHTFYVTFADCTRLTSIPTGLFKHIHNAGDEMFLDTFYNCRSLTSIPENLFASIQETGKTSFKGTFYNCTSLSGYIPPSLFAGLVAKGSPDASNLMIGIFSGTNLATTCPTGTVQFITGYEQYWDGHVSCVDENLVCNSGEYFPAHWYECKICPENNYCAGGTYTFNETVTQGIESCPNSWYSPAGSSSVAQCGRILHVGDNVVYLRSGKKTTPSLNFDLDNDGTPDFFSNMTTADVPMNINTKRKLKINYNGQTYSAYDDTVTVPE